MGSESSKNKSAKKASASVTVRDRSQREFNHLQTRRQTQNQYNEITSCIIKHKKFLYDLKFFPDDYYEVVHFEEYLLYQMKLYTKKGIELATIDEVDGIHERKKNLFTLNGKGCANANKRTFTKRSTKNLKLQTVIPNLQDSHQKQPFSFLTSNHALYGFNKQLTIINIQNSEIFEIEIEHTIFFAYGIRQNLKFNNNQGLSIAFGLDRGIQFGILDTNFTRVELQSKIYFKKHFPQMIRQLKETRFCAAMLDDTKKEYFIGIIDIESKTTKKLCYHPSPIIDIQFRQKKIVVAFTQDQSALIADLSSTISSLFEENENGLIVDGQVTPIPQELRKHKRKKGFKGLMQK